MKVRDGSYDKWIEDAKEETRRKIEEKRKKGVAGDKMEVDA